ncbi:MAG: hypothetical protein Q4A41_04470 [Bacillota bacterium]|nr:hypothetical protein [Bacillota bacterium]
MKLKIITISLVVITVAIALFSVFHERNNLNIGLLEGQEKMFVQVEKIVTVTGKNVHFRYYSGYEDMKKDVLSGELDLYIAPLFEHIVNPQNHLAVAAVQADYILAGKYRKNPIPVGVSEPHIAKILIDNAKDLKNKKYSVLRVRDDEKIAYLDEEVIDFAVFRNRIPKILEERGFSPIIKLSELGFTHDVLCVKKELLLRYDGLVEAIFLSSALNSHMLPSEAEIKNAIQYLFKTGAITERRRYTDYVHIR